MGVGVRAEGAIPVDGGSVWYCVLGAGPGTPLLTIHGGPGASSEYLHPLGALADERPVVLYDQLGGGRSDRPTNPCLWTIDRFSDELHRVRETLNLSEIHLLGHSWGALLALEYVLARPGGVRSLVLSSAPIIIPRYVAAMRRFRDALPFPIREVLDRHEAEGTTDSPEYGEACTAYRRLHLCRREPWPPEMARILVDLGIDVYCALWGPNSFFPTGVLRDYDRLDRLPHLRTPVLFTTGRHCAVTPEDVEEYASLVAGARTIVFENSAHMPTLEEPEAYAVAVGSFLREQDRGR